MVLRECDCASLPVPRVHSPPLFAHQNLDSLNEESVLLTCKTDIDDLNMTGRSNITFQRNSSNPIGKL